MTIYEQACNATLKALRNLLSGTIQGHEYRATVVTCEIKIKTKCPTRLGEYRGFCKGIEDALDFKEQS